MTPVSNCNMRRSSGSLQALLTIGYKPTQPFPTTRTRLGQIKPSREDEQSPWSRKQVCGMHRLVLHVCRKAHLEGRLRSPPC